MVRKILAVCSVFVILSCSELQQVVGNLPQQTTEKSISNGILSNADIGAGLREALDLGIEKQVSKLTQKNGFFGNQMVKILLPDELKKVDKGLRSIGLGSLADEGLKVLNRAAEDAVGEATPIFVNAVKGITFNDAKNILLGDENAATKYLENKTETALYSKFNPVIKNSFNKVGADKVWSNIISKYNNIPFVNKVNPDLTDYTTQEALNGVYKMIAVEEKEIRNNVNTRSTNLLKKVFALQD